MVDGLESDRKDKTFAPFGDARHKIAGGDVRKRREMCFSTYQAIAHDEMRPGLYREFPPDFFDLVIVDELAARRSLGAGERSYLSRTGSRRHPSMSITTPPVPCETRMVAARRASGVTHRGIGRTN